MPAPAVVVYVIVGAVAIVTGLSFYMWWNWGKIVIALKGKNIAILGSEGVGKTTLNEFLHGGEIKPESKILKRNILKLQDLKFYVKDGEDVSGGDMYLGKWKDLFLKSNITLYLFDSKKVYDGDKEYIDEIINRMRLLSSWKQEKNKNIQMVMIGTYSDLIDGIYSKKSAKLINEKIKENITPALNQGDIDHDNLIVGSLKDDNNIQILVGALLVLLYKKK